MEINKLFLYKDYNPCRIYIINYQMLKPLLRTIVTLSGNVKLGCMVTNYNKESNNIYNGYVRDGKLVSLANQLYQYPINISLAQSSYEYDLYKFYSRYSNVFYDNCFSYNKEEIHKFDEVNPENVRNTNFEFGCKRVSYNKNKYQFAFFAPIYCESLEDMPDYFMIKIDIENNSFKTTKYIKINIGSNSDNNDNYLYKYLYKYLNKIDSNVIFCTPQVGAATYYGINVLSGGFSTISDSIFNNIYTKQYTIGMFDYQICNGFERNKLVMKQIIPLAFYFNVNDLLTDIEKLKYKNSVMNISGNYYKDDKKVSFYDFSIDYDYYNQSILKYNELTFDMNYEENDINCMDLDWPALHDMRYIGNQFANKINILHTRWKLAYSDDARPYIINLNYGYSSNCLQGYTKYAEYPSRYYLLTGTAEITNDNKFNALLPSEPDKVDYDSNTDLTNYFKYIAKVNEYKYFLTLQNNYSTNWFTIANHEDKLFDDNKWFDVINGKSYVNGILYNINEEFNYFDTLYNIDKFNIFVYINNTDVNDSITKHKIAYNTLENFYLYDNTYASNCNFTVDNIIDNSITDDNIVIYSKNDIVTIYEYNTGFSTNTSINPSIIYKENSSINTKATIDNSVNYVKSSLTKYLWKLNVNSSTDWNPINMYTDTTNGDYSLLDFLDNEFLKLSQEEINTYLIEYNGKKYARMYNSNGILQSSINNNAGYVYYEFRGSNIEDYVGYMINSNSIKANIKDINIEESGSIWDTDLNKKYNLIDTTEASNSRITENKYIVEYTATTDDQIELAEKIKNESFELYDFYYKEKNDDDVTNNTNCIVNIINEHDSTEGTTPYTKQDIEVLKKQKLNLIFKNKDILNSLGIYIDISDLDIDYYAHNTFYLTPTYITAKNDNFYESISAFLIKDVYVELPIYTFNNISKLIDSNINLKQYIYVYIYDEQDYYSINDLINNYNKIYHNCAYKTYPYISFYIKTNIISKENYNKIKFGLLKESTGDINETKICTSIPLYFEQTPIYQGLKYNSNIYKYQTRKNYGTHIANKKTAKITYLEDANYDLNHIYCYNEDKPESINFDNTNLINNDNDLLWVDTYNLKKVYGLDNNTDQGYPDFNRLYTKEFYANFLDMKHVNLYLSTIYTSDCESNADKHVYSRIPNIRYDKYFNCYIEYTYKEIPYKEIHKNYTYNSTSKTFIYKSGTTQEKQVVLCFKKKFALVNRHIYNYIINLTGYICPVCQSRAEFNYETKRFECTACSWNSTIIDTDDDPNNNGLTYNDLYLYTLSNYGNDSKNVNNIEYTIIKDAEDYWGDSNNTSPNINSEFSEGACLHPLFNDVYVEGVESTVIYSNYKLDAIYKVTFENQYTESIIDNRFIYYNTLSLNDNKINYVKTYLKVNPTISNNKLGFELINTINDDVYTLANNTNYVKHSMINISIQHNNEKNKEYNYKKVFEATDINGNINNGFIGANLNINKYDYTINLITGIKIDEDYIDNYSFNNYSALYNTSGLFANISTIDITKLNIEKIKRNSEWRYEIPITEMKQTQIEYEYYFKDIKDGVYNDYIYTSDGTNKLLLSGGTIDNTEYIKMLYNDKYITLLHNDNTYLLGSTINDTYFPISFEYDTIKNGSQLVKFNSDNISYDVINTKTKNDNYLVYSNYIDNKLNIKFYTDNDNKDKNNNNTKCYLISNSYLYFIDSDNNIFNLNKNNDSFTFNIYSILNKESDNKQVVVNDINYNNSNITFITDIKDYIYYEIHDSSAKSYNMLANNYFIKNDNNLYLKETVIDNEYDIIIHQDLSNILNINFNEDALPIATYDNSKKGEDETLVLEKYSLIINNLKDKHISNFYETANTYCYSNTNNGLLYLNVKDNKVYLDDLIPEYKYIIKLDNPEYGYVEDAEQYIYNDCIINNENISYTGINGEQSVYTIKYDNKDDEFDLDKNRNDVTDKTTGIFLNDITSTNSGEYINVIVVEESGQISCRINMQVDTLYDETLGKDKPFVYYTTSKNSITGKEERVELIRCINRFAFDDDGNNKTYWVEVHDFDKVQKDGLIHPYILMDNNGLKKLYVYKSNIEGQEGVYFIDNVEKIIRRTNKYYINIENNITADNYSHERKYISKDEEGNFYLDNISLIREYIISVDSTNSNSIDNENSYEGLDIDFEENPNSSWPIDEDEPDALMYIIDTDIYKLNNIRLYDGDYNLIKNTEDKNNLSEDSTIDLYDSYRRPYDDSQEFINITIDKNEDSSPLYYVSEDVLVKVSKNYLLKLTNDNLNYDNYESDIYSILNIDIIEGIYNYYINCYNTQILCKTIDETPKYILIDIVRYALNPDKTVIYTIAQDLVTSIVKNENNITYYARVFSDSEKLYIKYNYACIETNYGYNYKINHIYNKLKNIYYDTELPKNNQSYWGNLISSGYSISNIINYQTYTVIVTSEINGDLKIGTNVNSSFILIDYISNYSYNIKYDSKYNTYYIDSIDKVTNYTGIYDGIYIYANAKIIKELFDIYYNNINKQYYISKYQQYYLFGESGKQVIINNNQENNNIKLNAKSSIDNYNVSDYTTTYVEILYPIYKYNNKYYVKNDYFDNNSINDDIKENTNKVIFIYNDIVYNINPISKEFSGNVTTFNSTYYDTYETLDDNNDTITKDITIQEIYNTSVTDDYIYISICGRILTFVKDVSIPNMYTYTCNDFDLFTSPLAKNGDNAYSVCKYYSDDEIEINNNNLLTNYIDSNIKFIQISKDDESVVYFDKTVDDVNSGDIDNKTEVKVNYNIYFSNLSEDKSRIYIPGYMGVRSNNIPYFVFTNESLQSSIYANNKYAKYYFDNKILNEDNTVDLTADNTENNVLVQILPINKNDSIPYYICNFVHSYEYTYYINGDEIGSIDPNVAESINDYYNLSAKLYVNKAMTEYININFKVKDTNTYDENTNRIFTYSITYSYEQFNNKEIEYLYNDYNVLVFNKYKDVNNGNDNLVQTYTGENNYYIVYESGINNYITIKYYTEDTKDSGGKIIKLYLEYIFEEDQIADNEIDIPINNNIDITPTITYKTHEFLKSLINDNIKYTISDESNYNSKLDRYAVRLNDKYVLLFRDENKGIYKVTENLVFIDLIRDTDITNDNSYDSYEISSIEEINEEGLDIYTNEKLPKVEYFLMSLDENTYDINYSIQLNEYNYIYNDINSTDNDKDVKEIKQYIFLCNTNDSFGYYINVKKDNGEYEQVYLKTIDPIDENKSIDKGNGENKIICFDDSGKDTNHYIIDTSKDLTVLNLQITKPLFNCGGKSIMYINNVQEKYSTSTDETDNTYRKLTTYLETDGLSGTDLSDINNTIYNNILQTIDEHNFYMFDNNYYMYYINPKNHLYEYNYSTIKDYWFINTKTISKYNLCDAYRVNSQYHNLLLIDISSKNDYVLDLIKNKMLEDPLFLYYLTTYKLYKEDEYEFIDKNTLSSITPISLYKDDINTIISNTYSSDNSKLLITKYNGITYAYYIINIMFENDNTMLNYYYKLENSSDINVNLISYINNVNIIDNPNYIDKVFKIILPYTNINMFGYWPYIKSMLKPNKFSIDMRSKAINIDNFNNDKDRYNIVNTGNENKINMWRYFDSIKPYIIKSNNNISNYYELKNKDVKISLINSGDNNFNGDSVLYSHDININEYNGIGIFNEQSTIPYKYIKPYEYKYFNDNKFINLIEEFIVNYNGSYVTYDKLLELENYENTLEVFKKYMNNMHINTYTENEILFLYNKYDKLYLSKSEGLDGNNKIYSLKYKFTLL